MFGTRKSSVYLLQLANDLTRFNFNGELHLALAMFYNPEATLIDYGKD
jgi:hypothetical protein